MQRSVGYFSVDSGYFSLTEHFTIHSDESQFRIVTQLPKFGTLELNESLVGLLGENYLQNLTHPLKVCGAGRGNRRSGQVLFFTVVVVVTGTSPVFASLVSVVVKISFPLVGVWHRRQETETTLFGRARGGTQGASLKKKARLDFCRTFSNAVAYISHLRLSSFLLLILFSILFLRDAHFRHCGHLRGFDHGGHGEVGPGVMTGHLGVDPRKGGESTAGSANATNVQDNLSKMSGNPRRLFVDKLAKC